MRFTAAFEWLEHTALAIFVRDSLWLFPMIEIVHILGFTVLVGSAVMFDLRLLGIARGVGIVDAANLLLPWSRRALIAVIPSGVLLFITQAAALSTNSVFGLKLILIGLAGANALFFHRFTFRMVSQWPRSKTPASARAAAVVSLVLWTAVITCGRLIAYL